MSAAEPGIAPVLEANIPRNNDTWHAASPEPEEIPPLRLAEIPDCRNRLTALQPPKSPRMR